LNLTRASVVDIPVGFFIGNSMSDFDAADAFGLLIFEHDEA